MRIYIGNNNDRSGIIAEYMQRHQLQKLVLFGEPLAGLEQYDVYQCPYNECTMYKHYYKYLAFTDKQTLFVWSDCLRTQKRTALEYNCIRHCCEQTEHRLVFEALPIIREKEDFLTLYELLEPNTFVKLNFADLGKLKNVDFTGFAMPEITADFIETTEEQKAKYLQLKEDTIKAVKRDANIIPRRLLKYAESLAGKGYDTKSELLARDMRVSVTDLKVDQYFYNELLKILAEVKYVTDCI